MKKELGNPMLVAALAPAIKENAPIVIKTASSLLTKILAAGVIIGGVYFGSKAWKKRQQDKLISQSAYDVNIRASVNIYEAIPDGLKEGKGSMFTPLGFVVDLWNKIKLVWQSTDSQKIYGQATLITNWDKTAASFKTLFGENILDILKVGLTDAQYNQFLAEATRPKVQSGTAQMGMHAYTNKATNGYLIKFVYPQSTSFVPLKYGLPKNADLGIATGNELKSTLDQQMYVSFVIERNGIKYAIGVKKTDCTFVNSATYAGVKANLINNYSL